MAEQWELLAICCAYKSSEAYVNEVKWLNIGLRVWPHNWQVVYEVCGQNLEVQNSANCRMKNTCWKFSEAINNYFNNK